jgi:hypothetical protein
MTSDDGGWVERSVKVRVRYRYPHSHSIVLTDGSVDPIPKKFPPKTSRRPDPSESSRCLTGVHANSLK